MWYLLAGMGITAALIAAVISHLNYKRREKIEASIERAAVKSHHKARKKGQKRQY